jgi:hypothetical protein
MHVIDNTGSGTSQGYEGVLLRFTRFDGIEVRGNHQRVGDGITPVLLHASCNATVSGNDFPGASAAATVKEEGDCSTPIKPRARSSTITGPRAATKTRPPRVPRTVSPVTPTAVPPKSGGSSGGTSAATVAVAVGIGALAGIGGTLLVQWGRTDRAPDEAPEEAPEETPEA